MYILLTGRPPYSGKNTETILKQVKNTPFMVNPIKLQELSDEAVQLLINLLTFSPEKRISAREAIQSPWIENYRNSSRPGIEITLSNLKNFKCESKLKEAVHIFLASQVVSNEELKTIRKNFQILDKDGDGKITREELFAEYIKTNNLHDANRIVDEVLARLDQDGDGNIDYTEFLVSCSEYQQLVSRENLEIAFKMFDVDGNGIITVDEIKNTLENGQLAKEGTWDLMLKEADTNGDGVIDLKEFNALMQNKL